jgi:hypothetical protein
VAEENEEEEEEIQNIPPSCQNQLDVLNREMSLRRA